MIFRGMSCVKNLLFAFNFVFAIFGILLLYSGFKTLAQIDIYVNKYKEVINDWPNYEAFCLIMFGFVIFLTTFLGCYGAIKESKSILNTFIAIMLGILVSIIAGYIFTFRPNLNPVAEEGIKKSIENYNSTQTDDPTNKALDDIQTHLKCCGAKNYSDWFRNHEYNRTRALPHSCCANQTVNVEDCSKEKAYASGCVKLIDDEIRGSLGLFGGIAFAFAVIQLLGLVIFSLCLCYKLSINKGHEYV